MAGSLGAMEVFFFLMDLRVKCSYGWFFLELRTCVYEELCILDR